MLLQFGADLPPAAIRYPVARQATFDPRVLAHEGAAAGSDHDRLWRAPSSSHVFLPAHAAVTGNRPSSFDEQVERRTVIHN